MCRSRHTPSCELAMPHTLTSLVIKILMIYILIFQETRYPTHCVSAFRSTYEPVSLLREVFICTQDSTLH